jgi:hypothetical protein
MKLARWVLCVTLILGIAGAVALAQDEVPIVISVDAKVIPNRAGTKKHPQPVRVDVRAHVTIPEAYDPPLVDTVDVWLPKGGVYNGGRYPKCSEAVLARKGVRGCPRGSIMGHGTAKATADTVFTYPRITVVNGGAKRVFFYTVMDNPARVQAPIPAVITKPGGRWAYRVHATVPKVLQVVAGIPIVLREAHVAAGSAHKDWLATTSCPRDHRWRYHVLITFTTGQVKTYDNSVRCR